MARAALPHMRRPRGEGTKEPGGRDARRASRMVGLAGLGPATPTLKVRAQARIFKEICKSLAICCQSGRMEKKAEPSPGGTRPR